MVSGLEIGEKMFFNYIITKYSVTRMNILKTGERRVNLINHPNR